MEDWRKLAAESEKRHEKVPERRKGSGPLLKIISLFGFISWVLMLPVLVLVQKAKPEIETFFDRWINLEVNSTWDLTLFRYAFYLMLIIMLLSLFGLALNALRMRRKTDSWRVNLILVFLLSLSGIIYYFLY